MANDGTQRMRSHTHATTPDGPEASLQQNAIQNPTRTGNLCQDLVSFDGSIYEETRQFKRRTSLRRCTGRQHSSG